MNREKFRSVLRKTTALATLALLSTLLTFCLIESSSYLLLRLSPLSYEPFKHIVWMRSAFHPLFRRSNSEPFSFWPFTGDFYNPPSKLPPGLPTPFPEAYIYYDMWGHMTPMDKPKNELRICVLGGSTMAGMGSTSAVTTTPARLEHWLRELQPKDSPWTIRVMNAGVVGYTSTQEQSHMATRLLPYHPDAFVVVDGYNDFGVLWEVPNLPPFWDSYQKHLYEGFQRMQSPMGVAAQVGFLASKRLYSLALPRAFLNYRKRQASTAGTSAAGAGKAAQTPAGQLNKTIDVYRWNMHTMIGMGIGHGIPLIMSLQPTLAYAKPPSPSEKALLEARAALGSRGVNDVLVTFYERLREVYRIEARDHPGRVLDESRLFSSDKETIYIDHCHYNDRGADILARELARPVYAALRSHIGHGL